MKIISLIMCFIFTLNNVGDISNLSYEYTEEPIIAAMADVEIQSKSAILMEASSGTVIFEKNPDERLKPASVTKVMTLLLIFEAMERGEFTYEDIVTISEHAASMGGSQCFFEAGEEQTVRDMIKCIEIASGNDAAVAMAEYVAGSEVAFVELMNQRARELGMENTNFVNACGLDVENHYTTARDIGIMSRELITKHPDIIDFSTIWMDSIIHTTKRGQSQFDLANTNKFLNMYNGATGLKTGYTSEAKYCMSATATRDGVSMIAVIMGAETKDIRNNEACKLLDYGFAKCDIYVDSNVLNGTVKVEVKKGEKDYVNGTEINIHEIVLLEQNPEAIEKNVVLYKNLEAPVYKNDIIGSVQYSYNGQLIDEIFIYATEDVNEITYKSTLKNLFGRLFIAN